jgi:predicted ATP-grasp superfamily ATP-dependent carboligase
MIQEQKHKKYSDVLVVGADSPIGLTAIRELGEYGVTVYATVSHKFALVRFSKYTKKSFILPQQKDFAEKINLICAEYNIRYIICCGEKDCIILTAAYEDGILHEAVPLTAPIAVQRNVHEKIQTYHKANEIGLDYPKTWQISSLEDLESYITVIEFPVVLKWSDSGFVQELLKKNNLDYIKADYIHDADCLRKAMIYYKSIGLFPMIQQYIAGIGIGQMFYMQNGEAKICFQHERIAEWPPEGGVSTICKVIPQNEFVDIKEKSIELLQALKWQGAAMVEYRYDPIKKKAWLMEINGRFWGSLPLAYHAKAGFVWATYKDKVLKQDVTQPNYIDNRQAIFMLPQIKRLFRLTFQRHKIKDPYYKVSVVKCYITAIRIFFSPNTRFYVFQWKDPMPFIADVAYAVVRNIKKINFHFFTNQK